MRIALAAALAVLTAGAVLALAGLRVRNVEKTTFPRGVPGNAGGEFAHTSKHLHVGIEEQSKWVYPVATFVGVFGIGLVQVVLTHRPARRAADSRSEAPVP